MLKVETPADVLAADIFLYIIPIKAHGADFRLALVSKKLYTPA